MIILVFDAFVSSYVHRYVLEKKFVLTTEKRTSNEKTGGLDEEGMRRRERATTKTVNHRSTNEILSSLVGGK